MPYQPKRTPVRKQPQIRSNNSSSYDASGQAKESIMIFKDTVISRDNIVGYATIYFSKRQT